MKRQIWASRVDQTSTQANFEIINFQLSAKEPLSTIDKSSTSAKKYYILWKMVIVNSISTFQNCQILSDAIGERTMAANKNNEPKKAKE